MKRKFYIFGFVFLMAFAAHAQEYTDTNDTDESLLPEGLQMYELDSLLNDWMTRNYLTNVENCLSTGVNPEFDDETYIQRLSRLPNVIEMPYNEIVRKYIDRYCERLRPSVSIMLGSCNFYNPIFEEALESYQVPLELRNLPIIESALQPNARSRA
jgi:membrane-bound lytic murein transglycosylase D